MVSQFSDSDEEVAASTSRSTTSRGRKVSYKMAIDSDDNSDDVPMFDDEDSGSDFEIEPPIKKSATPKAPAAKPRAKPAAKPRAPKATKATKSSSPDSLNGHAEENGNDRPVQNGNGNPSGNNDASSQYQKLTQLEHILKRPDTYIGSVEKTEMKMWVYDEPSQSMVHRDVKIVPGLYKIFDEILVNAADNKIRDPSMDTLDVKIDPETNTISVLNNGKGIPIEIHKKEKIYIPELIFGNLLTSSNYDDDAKKVTGGRNGYGAKLCNIFSTEFTVETGDKATKRKYKQVWKKNMSEFEEPNISKVSKGQDYTRITFKPDLTLFHMDSMDEDLVAVLYRRVYDLAGCMRNCKVILNGKRLHIKDFKSYTEMFVKALEKSHQETTAESEEPEEKKPIIVYERINDRWEIAFSVSDGAFNQVSFVNSIATTSGGTHVNYIADQITSKISEEIKKKKQPIKTLQIKNNMFLFINCLIENPSFTSQTKEQLTTRKTAFGSQCELSPEFLKKIMKTPILDRVKDIASNNADKEIRKTDGGKTRRIKDTSKLEDANKAGTREGHKCTLILTEGDSAMSLAVAGLAVVGRDYYGVYPLRGKLLNVREASHDQITKNAQIQAIKKIMGLQHKKHYTSTQELRYGHIMIMTDQDHDGSHIKGLIINFLESTFPGLLEIPGFLVEFITPIIKVSIYRGKRISEVIPFYTMPEYEEWRETVGKTCVWKKKYYKGLGTSEPKEGREYFSLLDKHLKHFHELQSEDKPMIELAFSKKKADERKDWLRQFRPGTHLDPNLSVIPIRDFINKELILFSIADNMRSIPSVLDGLKPGQRKVLYGCFKRNLVTEIKVAQLAGYISENTGYHHGEPSLIQTIVNLAQNFVGSNNLNLLLPKGSFGSRASGGKDSSAPRYIYTELNPLTRKIFHPADEKIYTYVEDDENTVEPEWYVPILPMVLVNGAEGIGTGWSTNIPPFNPVDIITNLRHLMNGEEMESMIPWYRGWTGTIEAMPDNKFKAIGTITQIDDVTLEITELPPYFWTINMREFLLAQLKDRRDSKVGWIDDFTEDHGLGVKFVVKLSPQEMAKAVSDGLHSRFKLTSNINLSNMIAFDTQNRIKKYASPFEIINDFYFVRLEFYQKRKNYLSNQLKNQLTKLSEQARFVKMIIEKKFIVTNRKKVDIIKDLQNNKFPAFSKDNIPKYVGVEDFVADDDDEDEEIPDDVENPLKNNANYDYLLGMQIWSLTLERYQRLLKDCRNKEEELNTLLKKTPKDLWNEDLDIFLEKWEVFLEEDRIERESLVPKSKAKGRKAGAAKRKRDVDEDFVLSGKRNGSAGKKVKNETKREPVSRPKKTTVKKESSNEILEDEISDPKIKAKQTTLDHFKPKSASPVKKDDSKKDIFASLAGDIFDTKVDSIAEVKLDEPKSAPKRAASKFAALFISDDEDKDDIFSPKKKATKEKIVAVKEKPAASEKSVSTTEKPAPKEKAGAKSNKKGKGADKWSLMIVSDDEESDNEASTAATRPKRNARGPRKRYTADSEDSDNSIDVDESFSD